MQDVNFKYTLQSYQRKDGQVSDFGEIYLQANNTYFPHQSWTDFGCGAVYVWAEEFINLLEGTETKVECNFYDGAYLFYVEKTKNKKWKITFVNEDNDRDFEYEFFIDPIQICNSLLDAVKFMKEIRLQQEDEEAAEKYKIREKNFQKAIINNL